MDIVERLRKIDFTFWYSPVGPDEKFEPMEIGKLSHEAADEIDKLRKALRYYAKTDYFPTSDGPWGVDSDDFGNIARAALKENS